MRHSPQFHAAGYSDQGRVRERNEDRWLADAAHGLFIVADGMGGGPHGSLAADIVVQVLPALLGRHLQGVTNLTGSEGQDSVRGAIVELSGQLQRQTQDQPGLEGMGATLVLLVASGQGALVAHLGDSRAYLLREGRLAQLTHDHSLIQLLLDEHEITPEEAAQHPARGQLTQYVGMCGTPLPDVQSLALHPDDRILLCSDGLSGLLGQDQLQSLLALDTSAEHTCRSLVAAANANGGHDNITAVVVTVQAGVRANTSALPPSLPTLRANRPALTTTQMDGEHRSED